MSGVSIVKVINHHVDEALRKAASLAEDFDDLPWRHAKVLIKPNTVHPVGTGTGIVTDARIVEAATRLALEKTPKQVVIGEGSSVGYDFSDCWNSMHCMEVAGIRDVAGNLGVEVVDLNQDERVEVRAEGAFVMERFAVAKTAWEAEIIVSVPVIKTHVRTGITCSLKNMKGVLPGDEKRRTHRLGLDRGIVDLNRVVKPTFTFVDGIVGVQGVWGANAVGCDRVPLDVIVAGSDAVAVDTVSATVAGFNANDILHVQLADEANLGVADLGRIQIRGEEIRSVQRRFTPFLEAAQDLFAGAKIIEENTCTGCMGECVSTFIYLKRAGFQDRLSDLTLIMGTPDTIAEPVVRPVVLGRCAKAYRHLGVFVPGCPPHGKEITDAVCQALDIDERVVHSAIEKLHDF